MTARDVLWDRLGAASGILSAVLIFAGFSMTGSSNPPSPDEPSANLAAYLIREAERSDIALSLALISVFSFFWFIGYLRHNVRRAEGENGWLASVAHGGGVVFAAMLLVMLSLVAASSVLSDYGADTQVAKTLFVLNWNFVYVFGPPLAALVGATSVAAVLYAALPRWLGWAGLVITLALLIAPISFFGFLLFFVWVVVVSGVWLFRSIRGPRREIAAQSA